MGGYTPRGVVQLSDGTVLMVTADHPLNRKAYAVHSPDEARTWEKPVFIAAKGDEDISEPAAAVLPGDKVVVMIRNDDTGYRHRRLRWNRSLCAADGLGDADQHPAARHGGALSRPR